MNDEQLLTKEEARRKKGFYGRVGEEKEPSQFLFFNEIITVIARRNDEAIPKFITKNKSMRL